MGATTKRYRTQYLVILIVFFIGWWIFWFQFNQSLQSTPYPKLIPTINKAETEQDNIGNITLLMHEIKYLQTRNTRIENEKAQLRQEINKQPVLQHPNHDTALLLDEIDELKKTIWDLQDADQQNKMQNNELNQQIKSLTTDKTDDINYYFLYGFCNDNTHQLNKEVIVIMDGIKNYVSTKYNDWIVLSVSIQQFLMDTNSQNYTHKKLMRFTKSAVPNINIKRDKFQWVFEPHCAEFHTDLKAYYDDKLLYLPLPPDIYEYHNVSTTNKFGFIDDNDRYSDNDHIVNINYHKYDNYYLNISHPYRVLNVWQNDSYYSFCHNDERYPLSLRNNRPFLMEIGGEAFSAWSVRRKYACFDIDFHIQRSRSWPRRGCIVALFIQGIIQRDVPYNLRRKYQSYQDLMNYHRLIINDNNAQTRELYIDEIMKQKKRFCSFTVKTLFMWGYYLSEALVRHVVHAMISRQYKYCHMLGTYHDHRKWWYYGKRKWPFIVIDFRL